MAVYGGITALSINPYIDQKTRDILLEANEKRFAPIIDVPSHVYNPSPNALPHDAIK